MFLFHVFPLIAVLLATGCSKPLPTPTARLSELRQAEWRRDAARFSSTDEAPKLDVEVYSLKARFDWSSLMLHATLTTKLKSLSPQATRITLDSAVAKIHRVQLVEKPAPLPLPFSVADGKLHVELPAPRETVELVIEYETQANVSAAGTSSALVAVPPREGDPVAGRTLATLSEPLGVAEWMPCHNVPSDRALFSTEFEMPAEQRLIANGHLTSDAVAGTVRRMSYATEYGLPTYLMAFALGDFEVTDAYHGKLPISLWRRRSLPLDATGILRNVAADMAHFEKLLVPYPFEKYALVLLPDYTGGLEHAGITFQGEVSTTQPTLNYDAELSAHELGHQWFGDLVTIETWDDLWIKEGMATLLAQEGLRRREDLAGSGRLFGRHFYVVKDEAIRDKALSPDAKYTSGPYDRAAWLLTQIRALAGEQAFWSTLRDVLDRHRFGVIGTDAFLEAFRPVLGDANLSRVRRAVDAKAIPSLTVTRGSNGIAARLADPDGALVAPLAWRKLGAGGNATEGELAVDGTLELDPTSIALLLLDPRDSHPVRRFLASDESRGALEPLLRPSTPAAWEWLFAAGPHHQSDALSDAERWSTTPEIFAPAYPRWSAESVRYQGLVWGCESAAAKDASASVRSAWQQALRAALAQPPLLGMPTRDGDKGLSRCRLAFGESPFAATFEQLAAEPSLDEVQMHWLALFSDEPQRAFRAASALVRKGPSVRTREIALRMLNRHLEKDGNFAPPPESVLPQWKAFYRDVLTSNATLEVLRVAGEGVTTLDDAEALPALAHAMRAGRRPSLQRQLACWAATIAGDDTAQWATFRAAVGETKGFAKSVVEVLEKPGRCKGDEDNEPAPSPLMGM